MLPRNRPLPELLLDRKPHSPNRNRAMRGFYLFHVATGVALIAMLVGFYNLKNDASGRSGVIESVASSGTVGAAILPPRVSEEPLTFTNHLGEPVSELDYRGRHSLIFFGYASCPDVCPGNLVAMRRALDLLGEEAQSVQPLFVSFDPERDTPEVLSTYVAHFDPRLIGLTGTTEEIEAAALAYGVYYEVAKEEGTSEPTGEIHHTSNTFFLGPEGEARAIFRHNTNPEEMASIIRSKLAAADPTPAATASGLP